MSYIDLFDLPITLFKRSSLFNVSFTMFHHIPNVFYRILLYLFFLLFIGSSFLSRSNISTFLALYLTKLIQAIRFSRKFSNI